MPTWPASLPGLNVEGYGEEDVDAVVRTQMDAGPQFERLRYSAVPTRITDTLVLTTAQVATLMAFYRTTVSRGVSPFDWTHPRTGASVSMKIKSPPGISAAGGELWSVRVDFEILP